MLWQRTCKSIHKYFYWKYLCFPSCPLTFIDYVVPWVAVQSLLSICVSLIMQWIRSLIRSIAILQASAIFVIAFYFSSACWYKDLIKVVKITDNRCDVLNKKSALCDSSVDEKRINTTTVLWFSSIILCTKFG